MEIRDKVCEKIWDESSLVCTLGVGAAVGSLVMAVIVLIVI